MQLARKLALTLPLAFLLLPARPVFAADQLKRVLHQLDEAAKNFHTASADFEFKNIQTEPVPDTDVMTGTVYYQHKGHGFQMAAHIAQENNQPSPKVYTYSSGVFQLYDGRLDQVRKLKDNGSFGSYLMLGFGASGKELQDKWNITYLGEETLNGVKTDKLELIAKDPKVLRLFPSVIIWIDPTRAVNLKQVFDEGEGMTRVCTYSNIQVDRPIPAENFTFKTDRKTTYVN